MNKQISFFLILLLNAFSCSLHAQMETAHWYFGFGAGLDFTSGEPVVDTAGQISTREGCATVSDACGNLLFYTDGTYVYNRNHQRMWNGFNLNGGSSSTQSAIVVPKPGDNNIYYIFTTDESKPTNKGLNYTAVDMSLDNGLGDVIPNQKNIPLPLVNIPVGPARCEEKVTAVAKADNSGYWVITHYNDSFYTFSVTSDGVNAYPIVSKVGIVVDSYGPTGYDGGIGSLKASPDGSRLAIAHRAITGGYWSAPEDGALAVYDFDNTTGVVSNEKVIHNSAYGVDQSYYGIEFSPDGKAFYATVTTNDPSHYALCQYNLEATDIVASEYIIDSGFIPNGSGALQLAIDGKIYHTNPNWNDKYLSVISNPNIIYDAATGAAPSYEKDAVYLGGKLTIFGLPSFIPSFFQPEILIYSGEEGQYGMDREFCYGAGLSFDFNFNGCPNFITEISWDFGDGTTSTEPSPAHTYSSAGAYIVLLEYTYYGQSYSIFTEVVIHPFPVVGEEAFLRTCDTGEEHTFALTEAYPQINPGNETVTITFYATEAEATSGEGIPLPTDFPTQEAVVLYVRVENEFGCYVVVELDLLFYETPEITAENAQICAGNSITLTVNTEENNTVHWYESDEAETPVFTGPEFETPELAETTSYWVEVESEEGCKSERIEIRVTVNPLPDLVIEDTNPQICSGENITFNIATGENNTVNWYSSEEAEIPVHIGNPYEIEELTESISYWIEAVNEEGCKSERQEIVVTVNPLPELLIENTEVEICAGETVVLSVLTNATTVNWYETETSEIIIDTGNTITTQPLVETTSYWVEAISDEGCIAERQEIVVTVNPLPELTIETPSPACIENTTTLYVTSEGNTIYWYDSEDATEPIETGNSYVTPELLTTTSFWVEAESEEGCISERIEVPVIVYEQTTPEFTQIEPVCAGTTIELPIESENGITGTWFPAFNPNTTTHYTFTPDVGQCATIYEMTITVNEEIIPQFTQIEPVCEGTEFTLPTESENGITGTWSPEPDFTQSGTYTFTPDNGFCATTQVMTINITPKIVPEFDPIDPVCAETGFTLPTESLNGITGTWFPEPDFTQTEMYTFTPDNGFCATTQTMTVTVNPTPEVQDDEIYFCDSLNNGFEEVDLTQNNINITNAPNIVLKYYANPGDLANNSPIDDPEHFLINSSQGVVYVSAAAGNGCLAYAELTVILTGAPAVSDTSLEICSSDGMGTYQLTDANENIINNSNSYSITYHLTEQQAKNGSNPLPETYENTSANQIIFARVEEGENCFNIAEIVLTYSNTLGTITPLEECDDNTDGLATFDLTEKEPEISTIFGGSGHIIIYYESLENAYNNVNEIPNQESYTNETNPQTVYAKVYNGDICLGIVSFDLIVVQAPEIDIEKNITLCPGEDYLIEAPPGYESYTWTSPGGIVISTTNSAILDTEGIYTLEITFADNICTFREEIEVIFDETPVITNIEVNGTTVIVTANGTPPLEYSINAGQTWQSSNIFYNVPLGEYEVKVRNSNICLSGSYHPIVLFELTNIITPNGDGYNDTWEIPALANYPGASLKIVDRYGKTLVNTNLENGFVWDGKHNGNPLPSTSYWYVLDLNNGQKITGNVTIKNY